MPVTFPACGGVNGEAIYASKESPAFRRMFGEITNRARVKKRKLAPRNSCFVCCSGMRFDCIITSSVVRRAGTAPSRAPTQAAYCASFVLTHTRDVALQRSHRACVRL